MHLLSGFGHHHWLIVVAGDADSDTQICAPLLALELPRRRRRRRRCLVYSNYSSSQGLSEVHIVVSGRDLRSLSKICQADPCCAVAVSAGSGSVFYSTTQHRLENHIKPKEHVISNVQNSVYWRSLSVELNDPKKSEERNARTWLLFISVEKCVNEHKIAK